MIERMGARVALLGVAAAALFASAGCVTKTRYEEDTNALKAELASASAANEECRAEAAGLAMARDKCLGDLAALAQEKGAVSGDLDMALRRLAELKELNDKRQRMLDKLVESIRSMASASGMQVVQRNGQLIVQIAENILFDVGKSKLKAEGQAALAELSPVLASVNRKFQIMGHTDNTGAPEVNWRLSVQRSLSVLDEMLAAGYPPERISVAGVAFYEPTADNDSDEGRQRNRRVEIVLVPNLEELQLPALSATEPGPARVAAR